MKCPLNDNIDCPMEEVIGACFFCRRIDESYAVSKIPVLETDLISFMEEG